MRSYEVVAWADTEHGYVVCLDCAGAGEPEREEWVAVFAGSEWDYFPSCDRCHGVVYDVGLTPDGVEYYKEWLYGESDEMPLGVYAELSQIADPLIAALGDCGVRVETVVEECGDGLRVFVMYVPEGYACLPGHHDFDAAGECLTCGVLEG